jgi:autotransporter-associated beta strand protein
VNNITASSAAGALNLTASISGPGGFTKQGAGLATFGTGAKTYTGPTALNGGRMRISLAAHPSVTASFTINSNAQLTLISPGTYAFGTGPLHLNGSGPTNGPFAAFPGAIRPDTGLGITIGNSVMLDSDTVIHVQGAAAITTFSNTVSGPGKLTLGAPSHDANLGTLELTSSNSYGGGTVVHAGRIIVNGSGSLGSGNVTVHSASATFAGAIATLYLQPGPTNTGYAIADTATLSLAGGRTPGVADDGHLEVYGTERVAALVLAGVPQPEGTYGSTSSAATFKNDEFFAGTGILIVGAPEPLLQITAPTSR